MLSEGQAFDAMRCYLQAYWERSNTSLVSDVLSDTQTAFLADTVTADPAAWGRLAQGCQYGSRKDRLT
jgi:hypothetical protein